MIAGVDIGGTKIAVGMVNDNGQVREQQQCATDAAGGYRKAIANVERMLRSTSDKAGVEITGIGIRTCRSRWKTTVTLPRSQKRVGVPHETKTPCFT